MSVTIEDAYAEACKALGEQVVMTRLLQSELAKAEALLAAHAEPAVPLA